MNQPPTAFATLRKLVRRPPSPERCELCGAALPAEHPHVLELANRQIRCACGACALLFSGPESRRYRKVTPRIQPLPDFRMTDAQWESLHLPISLAFFFHSTAAGRVIALYPSPAGATESLLPLDAWQDLVSENPILAKLEPDVESLLVHRMGTTRVYYRLSIDECFKLVGLIRRHWRGFSGGQEVWDAIEGFFNELKERATDA